MNDDFYEDDQPVADVLAAFEAGKKVVTGRPVNGRTEYLALLTAVTPAGANTPNGSGELVRN